MAVLVAHLAGPLQSCGTEAAYDLRPTEALPTKSGTAGFLACCLGRGRGMDCSDIIKLSFAARADKPGTLVCDYHTAGGGYSGDRRMRAASGEKHLDAVVTDRWYLADAAFTVAFAGPDASIEELAEALRNPVWAPYLGRRSCPPTGPLLIGVLEGDHPVQVLQGLPVVGASADGAGQRTVRFCSDIDGPSAGQGLDAVEVAVAQTLTADMPMGLLDRRYRKRQVRSWAELRGPELFVPDVYELVKAAQEWPR